MTGPVEPAEGPGPEPAPVVRRTRAEPRPPRGGRLLVGAAVVAVVALACALGALTLDETTASAAAAPTGEARPSTPLLSARRVPEWTTRPLAGRALASAVEPVVQASPASTCITVGDGTEVLYAHNADLPLVPASNLKIVTAAAALDVLGPDATLSTELRSATRPEGGVLQGDLWVVGGGDPLLTSEAYQERQRRGRLPDTDLEGVADELVASGLRQVTGSVVGDATRYPQQYSVPGWPNRWLGNGTVAPLAPLLANDAWQIDPIDGSGGGGPAADPAAHAAAVLTRLLTARGVAVDGQPRSGAAPEESEVLLEVPSLPVSGIVEELLTFSDNTTAELLLKEMGRVTSGEATTAAGTTAVREWAAGAGFPLEGLVVEDGSGLSSGNRVTCSLLGEVLRSEGPDGVVADGLAVPGGSGTLSDRFVEGGWNERLRAKTGTLNEVTALSGWLQTRPGATLDFEILVNTEGSTVGTAELELQRRLLEALLDQPRTPPLEEAGPLPPDRP